MPRRGIAFILRVMRGERRWQRAFAAAVAAASTAMFGCSSTGSPCPTPPQLPAACMAPKLTVTIDAATIPSDGGVGCSMAFVNACRTALTRQFPECGDGSEWAALECDEDEAGVSVRCSAFVYYPVCEGRRPSGIASPAIASPMARIAHLEAASVPAFSRLRAELRSQRAPRSLLRACSRARRDEMRHARTTKALARARGAKVPPVVVGALPRRPLEAIALENAIEGCVRETWGALLATWQSKHARDPHVRAAMKTIARDETRHAALAWEIAHWAERRLPSHANARISRAVQRSRAELRAALSSIRGDDALGLPPAAVALCLFDAFQPARRCSAPR